MGLVVGGGSRILAAGPYGSARIRATPDDREWSESRFTDDHSPGRKFKIPEFAQPFSGLASERKLTREELIRAIRYAVAAEYKAIQPSMQRAESTDDVLTQQVLKDIAAEERVHAGEFLKLLKHLAPDEASSYDKGAAKVEEMIQKLK